MQTPYKFGSMEYPASNYADSMILPQNISGDVHDEKRNKNILYQTKNNKNLYNHIIYQMRKKQKYMEGLTWLAACIVVYAIVAISGVIPSIDNCNNLSTPFDFICLFFHIILHWILPLFFIFLIVCLIYKLYLSQRKIQIDNYYLKQNRQPYRY